MTVNPATELLAVEGASKHYGLAKVLDEVSFDVRPGEVHALLGGNGSGKSTLIKALAGVISFDGGGSITAPGGAVSTHKWSPSHAREAGLRFVHQDIGLFADLHLMDNLSLGNGYCRSAWGRVRWNESAARARTLLSRYGIEAEPRAIAAELSLAQQTMVAIARALQDVQDTDGAVVFLDEPTGALPSHEADALHSWLRTLVAKGHAVVLVTHDIEEALTRCERVTVLRDGRVLHSGAAGDLNRSRVIELIAGRSDLDTSRRTRATPETSTAEPVLRIDELRGHGIDLDGIAVAPGEIVGITGLLGSGAETVLRSLFGLVPDVQCSLQLIGRGYDPTGPRSAMKSGVAYLPGDRLRDGNFVGMSVLENLGAATMRRAAPRGRLHHRRELREARQLTESHRVRPAEPKRPIESLSGGNQQKVLLARWARRSPKVLLLEDPTRGVDVGARAEIWDLLVERADADGLAILVTSSDPEELSANCDRVLVLGHGRIYSVIEGSDITAARLTAASYEAENDAEESA